MPYERTKLGVDYAGSSSHLHHARIRGILQFERGRDCRGITKCQENHAQLLAGHRARQVLSFEVEWRLAYAL